MLTLGQVRLRLQGEYIGIYSAAECTNTLQSYLTELVRGMSLDQAAKIKNTQIAQELSLPPVKVRYILDPR